MKPPRISSAAEEHAARLRSAYPGVARCEVKQWLDSLRQLYKPVERASQ